jgi:integrase
LAFDEHGYEPSRGKVAVEGLLVEWLEQRTGRVSLTTMNTDRYLLPTPGQRSGRSGTEPILPMWFRKLHVGKVTGAAIVAWQDGLLARGLAPTSVKRHRESLSSFFAWCVAEGCIAANPVKAAAPPKDRRAREVMRPLTERDFEAVDRDVAEARAMLVRDFVEVPVPALNLVRNQPEGIPAAKTPKSGRGRRVPLPDALVPAPRRFAEDKGPDDLLLTRPGGGQLHRSMFVRQTSWSTVGRGRTLHDLRHTAACEWILRGVPLTTVQAWLGHGSIEVTARYLHHLGDSADRSAMQLLNDTSGALSGRAQQL